MNRQNFFEWVAALAFLVQAGGLCIETYRHRVAEEKLHRRIDVLSKVERGENLTWEELIIQHDDNGDRHYCERISRQRERELETRGWTGLRVP